MATTGDGRTVIEISGVSDIQFKCTSKGLTVQFQVPVYRRSILPELAAMGSGVVTIASSQAKLPETKPEGHQGELPLDGTAKPDPVVVAVGQRISDAVGPEPEAPRPLICRDCGAEMLLDGRRAKEDDPEAEVDVWHCPKCGRYESIPVEWPPELPAGWWHVPAEGQAWHFYPGGLQASVNRDGQHMSACGQFGLPEGEITGLAVPPDDMEVCPDCRVAMELPTEPSPVVKKFVADLRKADIIGENPEDSPAAPAEPLTEGWAKGVRSWHYYGTNRQSLCRDYTLGNPDDLRGGPMPVPQGDKRCQKCRHEFERILNGNKHPYASGPVRPTPAPDACPNLGSSDCALAAVNPEGQCVQQAEGQCLPA